MPANSSVLFTIRFTQETLEKKILSDELIEEVLRRSSDQSGRDWEFTFEDFQVEIFKRKIEYKIEFIVSRNVSIGESCRQRPLYH
jgi:hypothetical protein